MSGMRNRLADRRERIRNRPLVDFAYRVAVGVVGLVVLAVGIAAIPYPGPGWAIVFLGLAILVIGALTLNEMRRGLVNARIESLITQGVWVGRLIDEYEKAAVADSKN